MEKPTGTEAAPPSAAAPAVTTGRAAGTGAPEQPVPASASAAKPSSSAAEPEAHPPRRRLLLWLMLALTFSTGIVDAVGFLGLERVFIANMTGNVVILGMAAVGAEDLPVLGPAVALVAFGSGAVAAGAILRGTAGAWTARITWLLAVAAAVTAAVGAALLAFPTPEEAGLASVTAALAGVMGLQAAAARHLAVKDVTTVVVTSTFTGLAADSRLAGGRGAGAGRRAGAIVLMFAGAAVGALLLRHHPGTGLLAAAGICLGVALAGQAGNRRRRA